MRRLSRRMKLLPLSGAALVLATTSGCIAGDNFWADQAYTLASGLILAAINLALEPAGLGI